MKSYTTVVRTGEGDISHEMDLAIERAFEAIPEEHEFVDLKITPFDRLNYAFVTVIYKKDS